MQPETALEFAPYQTDVLFLLVGRNALPNYVASHLLLRPGGRLYLVHTEGTGGTGPVAQRLAARLAVFSPSLIAVDPRDLAEMKERMEGCLSGTPAGSIGLNYTGGTKVMAVHAYQAVEGFCNRRGREVVFSYLDADSLQLIVEPRIGHPGLRRPVAQAVSPTLVETFELHGCKVLDLLQTASACPDLVRALVRIYGSLEGIEIWKSGRRVLAESDGRPWPEVRDDLAGTGLDSETLLCLEQALVPADGCFSRRAAAKHMGFKTPVELQIWLDGKWLEDWGWSCLPNLGVQYCARNLQAVPPGASKNFEIDLALVRGYVLFAMSCTVEIKPRDAKLKFLEVYARARQIGGDEARVGLICPVDDDRAMQQEIEGQWGESGRIRVFGRRHLAGLQGHLKTWLDSV